MFLLNFFVSLSINICLFGEICIKFLYEEYLVISIFNSIFCVVNVMIVGWFSHVVLFSKFFVVSSCSPLFYMFVLCWFYGSVFLVSLSAGFSVVLMFLYLFLKGLCLRVSTFSLRFLEIMKLSFFAMPVLFVSPYTRIYLCVLCV
jgi:hypothetical protein